MNNYYSLLQKNPLFSGIPVEEINQLCQCLSAREKTFSQGAFVFHAGDPVRTLYLILSGRMDIIDEDFWGNRSIVETLPTHTLFGEAYVFAAASKYLVSVVAAEDAILLEIDPARLLKPCRQVCPCHARLVRNTVDILAEKIVRLTEKLGHVTRRTTREKTLSYLSQCARREKRNSFSIPYSRQQLADYLCVDRSALSHELRKLQDEGVLHYRKNQFSLYQINES